MPFKKHIRPSDIPAITAAIYVNSNHRKGILVLAFGKGHHEHLPEKFDVMFGTEEDEGWVRLLPGDDFSVDTHLAKKNGNGVKSRVSLSGIVSPDVPGSISARPCEYEVLLKDEEKHGFDIRLPSALLEYLDV